MKLRQFFHCYQYRNNFAVGIGLEKTFNSFFVFRLGLGFWCFSIAIPQKQKCAAVAREKRARIPNGS